MITYKGQKTVIGKRFLYENNVVTYAGKIYGDQYLFKNNDTEYILSESELTNLFEYTPDGKASIGVIDKGNKLRDTVLTYTEKELALLNDLIAGKTDDIDALNELYQNEYDELVFLDKYVQPTPTLDTVSLEAQKSYFSDINRNISNTDIVNLLASLQNFIKSNKGGNNNGTV